MKINPIDWVRSHPFKSIAFTAVFTFVASALGAADASWTVFAAVYGVPTVFWLWVAWRDSQKLL
jgi:hypothetical protein